MLKVATFSRTSTDYECQSKSIGNQVDILESWIEKNGYSLYRNYIDSGISGTKEKYRIGWKQLIEDGKEKKYDILLCKSYSRFGRNMVETLGAIRLLRENNIRIIFLEDNLDSKKDITKFGLFSWIAEQESQNTSKRITTVFSNFQEQGKIYNCRAAWGYRYDKELKNFVIDEKEACIIRRIFKLYLQGNGTTKIANILTSEGVRGKEGGIIRGNTIKNCILNEVYIGTLVQNKSKGIDVTISKRNKISDEEWVRHLGNHEAIIDTETFLEANRIFKINSEKSKNHRYSIKGIDKASNASLFSNILTCNDCGCSMTIRRKKGKKLYYNCSGYEKMGLKVGHSSNYITEEFLVDHIRDELNDIIASNYESIKIDSKNDVKSILMNQLKEIEKDIDKQITLSNNLLQLYSEKVISINQFHLQNESISNALNTLIKNKENIEQKIACMPKDNKNFKKDAESLINLPIEEWHNAMLKKIIDKIYVSVDGQIRVVWLIKK